MLSAIRFLAFFISLLQGVGAPAGQAPRPAAQAPSKPGDSPAQKPAPAKQAPNPDEELQRTVEEAGNDRAALVRNFEAYLKQFPESPRKAEIYRALVETSMRIRDTVRAADYAERLIALTPDDISMMLFAVDLLERTGEEAALTRATGYATRVLDRVEKAALEGKSPRVSPEEWERNKKRVEMNVLLIRGRLYAERRDFDSARKDLERSYLLQPNAPAAEKLGELAELQNDLERAIGQYALAFALPGAEGLTVDRLAIRRKLGNVWKRVHGSEAGLGEYLLAAFDRLSTEPQSDPPPPRNAGAKDPYEFVLRRVDSDSSVRLSDAKEKILVVNFWATWCGPCRELEPLFEQMARRYESNPGVLFLAASADEDESLVPAFVKREKMRATVVFADGLQVAMGVRAYPTIVILDRLGKVAYRAEGFDPDTFRKDLGDAVERALASPELAPPVAPHP